MIWRKWKFWLAVLATATLIGLLEGAQFYTGSAASDAPVSWVYAVSSTLPSWYVMVTLLPIVIWLSRRFPLDPSRWRRALWVHLVAAVVFAVVHITASSWLSYMLLPPAAESWELSAEFPRIFSGALSLFFVVDLFTYFALVGTYHAYDYARRYRERESAAAQLALKASRLEASLARANLETLRVQLNPHFLFNTLNAISVLAMKGERQSVVRMLTLLSELLRDTLEQKLQVVPLREDLELLERYLEIEQVRFRDRLTVERDIAPDVLDAEVPSLMLQPLVENALRHGIARMATAGYVRIEAFAVDGTLELRVIDSGPGFTQDLSTARAGVGLANTRARLEQLYGSEHELELRNRPGGGAAVTVRLPLRLCSGAVLDRLPDAATA
jgi:two-component system, LytTR family, sensor kinase